MRQLYKHIEIDGEEFRFFVQCSRCGKKKYGPGLPLICRNVKTLVRCTGGRANRLAQLLYNHRKANAVQRLAMSFNQCRYCREWVCDECYDTNNSQGACKSCSDKI